MTSQEVHDRHAMWMNFYYACKLGTVLCASDQSIWQKVGKFDWRTIGASDNYSPDSIPWPASVLLDGIE